LLKVLTELRPAPKLGAVVLVAAPFVGDGGWPADDLEFPRDWGAALPSGVEIHFVHGLDDDIAPPSHVDLYARAVPHATIRRLAGRDHQLNSDLSEVATIIAKR
jgi:hypothetical protein